MLASRCFKLVPLLLFAALATLPGRAAEGPDGGNSPAELDDSQNPDGKDEGKVMSQKEHDRRIDYIELPVTDMARMKRFYSSAFGWKMTDYGPDYTSFEDGRIAGGFNPERKAVAAGGPLVVLYAVDLEKILAAVESSGGKITTPPFEFPGGRRFHFSDPSGNELAVWSEK